MDKENVKENVLKLMKTTGELTACYSKNCGVLKIKLMDDKDYVALNTEYKNMKPSKKKDKLLDKLNENETLYNYNKCILKNCKNIYKNLLNIMKINVNTLPKTHHKYKEINYFISELENLMNSKTLFTKEENKLFLKNSRNLASIMSKI
jgi:alkyl hydroperoxide reductase subunit AhpF